MAAIWLCLYTLYDKEKCWCAKTHCHAYMYMYMYTLCSMYVDPYSAFIVLEDRHSHAEPPSILTHCYWVICISRKYELLQVTLQVNFLFITHFLFTTTFLFTTKKRKPWLPYMNRNCYIISAHLATRIHSHMCSTELELYSASEETPCSCKIQTARLSSSLHLAVQ